MMYLHLWLITKYAEKQSHSISEVSENLADPRSVTLQRTAMPLLHETHSFF